jgi:hypothetical protein
MAIESNYLVSTLYSQTYVQYARLAEIHRRIDARNTAKLENPKNNVALDQSSITSIAVPTIFLPKLIFLGLFSLCLSLISFECYSLDAYSFQNIQLASRIEKCAKLHVDVGRQKINSNSNFNK